MSGTGTDSGSIEIGNNTGLYDVDGCAYRCGANFDKMDGETSYYDTLECEGLGESSENVQDNPGDETPQDCITDDTGKTVCLNDEEMGCYEVNGKTECPSQNAVCGVQNGTFNCVEPEEEGCGFFNGEKICYTPDGEKVTEDSPDHPDNGGNLDGDPTNDATDPRPENEGGDPNNQPGDSTGQGDGATEGTAQEQLDELRQIDNKLDGVGDDLGGIDSSLDNLENANKGDPNAVRQGVREMIDTSGDAAVGQLDGLVESIEEPAPMQADDLNKFSQGLTDVLGAQPQCQDMRLGTSQLGFTISCADTAIIRDFIGFVIYALTFWRLFQIVTRKPA